MKDRVARVVHLTSQASLPYMLTEQIGGRERVGLLNFLSPLQLMQLAAAWFAPFGSFNDLSELVGDPTGTKSPSCPAR